VIKTLQSNSPRYAATESANLSLIANRPDSWKEETSVGTKWLRSRQEVSK
jgi:hypothetical protein